MRKRLLGCLLTVALLFGLMIPVAAITVAEQPTDRFFVNDFAGVIDADDENTMYSAGVQLYEKTGAQVVVVTLDEIGGTDSVMYATQLGRDWGVGDEEKNTGIVLLLAMEERDVGIAVGYGLEGAVTDAQSYMILDEYAIPYFEDGEYSAGLAAAYDALINEVYLEFGLQADPDYVPIEQIEKRDATLSSASLVVLLIVICIISVSLRRFRGRFPFVFLPTGGFHHHGGGFGGFGGGGGFGGFRGGGGSFGGGGASRKF